MPTGVQTVSTPIWTSAAVGRPFHVEMKFKKEKKKKENVMAVRSFWNGAHVSILASKTFVKFTKIYINNKHKFKISNPGCNFPGAYGAV